MELEGITSPSSNQEEPSLNHTLPKVKMKFLKKEYLCVIDTGSTVSIINSNIIGITKIKDYHGSLLKSATGDLLPS